MKKFYILVISFICFIPFKSVKAAGSYSVQMVSGSSSNRVVGTYNTFAGAVDGMFSQKSDENNVATIYKDTVPVDSIYALFKFKPKTMIKLYREEGGSNVYTIINSSYASEAALLGYSEVGRVKIMVSGFIGWTDLNNGIVTPISLLSGNMININGSGVRLRMYPYLTSDTITQISGNYNFNYVDTRVADGYTWYNIYYNGRSVWVAGGSWVKTYDTSVGTYYLNYSGSGNLIHHFEEYNGVNYEDSFSNLGTSPSYLSKDVRYYSFDGNYYYDSLTSMLKDYKEGGYSRSINSNNPHYPYYLYLTARSITGYTKDDIDYIVNSSGYGYAKLGGTGTYFKEAEELYGTNALLAFSTAINESAWGTSTLAQNKNNLFGYGAYDSCPYECAHTYASPRDSILEYAKASANSYEALGGKYYFGSHYGNKSSGKNIMYATHPYWGEIMATNAFIKDKNFGGKDFNSNTIGVTKKGLSGVKVYFSPNISGPYVTLKSNYSDPVYDFSVNVVDKVTSDGRIFYKVYTDIKDRNPLYGYILEEYLNVSNNQPIINAEDKVVKAHSTFNYLEGVSAYDTENGDISYSLTYEGNVNIDNEGGYKVTYTAVDNSNFHVSKTINVKVVSDFSIEGRELIYNKENQKLALMSGSETTYFSLEKELNVSNYNEGTTDIPSASESGDYTVYYYNLNRNQSGKVNTVIKKNKVTNPTVKKYSGIYDGEAHTISVSGGEGGQILYSTDGENYCNVLPEYTELGTYKIYVKVEPDKNHEATDVIESEVRIMNIEDVNPSVNYQTHIQNIGWDSITSDGKVSGTEGRSLRLEGIKINLSDDISGDITYSTHVQNIGWTDFVKNGEMSGTEGRSLRLEAIKIKLDGEISKYYDIYYKVHAEGFGWLGWARNGEAAGSSGYSYRLEAIQIKLVKKGEEIDREKEAYKFEKIFYHTHVQNVGWQDIVSDGAMSGTEGRSLRLEGIRIRLSDEIDGGVNYSTHIQNIGWQDYVTDTYTSGTEGLSLRLEAIKIRLTGEAKEKYDIYYRVHSELFGWMGWARNDEEAGTSGYGYRLEGIQIKLVSKGEKVEGYGNSYKSKN